MPDAAPAELLKLNHADPLAIKPDVDAVALKTLDNADAQPTATAAERLKFNDKQQANAFTEAYPALCTKFIDYVKEKFPPVPQSALDRLKRMIDYNVLGGKYYRACLVTSTVQAICIAKGQPGITTSMWNAALAAGWAIEVMQAMFLVADDMMDKSLTRRKKPCWYLVEDVKNDAINDALILDSLVYYILDQQFEDDMRQHYEILRLFQELSLATKIGQMFDLTSQPQDQRNVMILRSFNMDMYVRIVTYKTALYTFYLPLAAGMLIAGMHEPSDRKLVKEISIELGIKFQIQDDYLDCYGEPEVIGKVGTDILDHKCSWLVVQALRILKGDPELIKRHPNLELSAEKRQEFTTILEENYGHHDAAKESEIKKLFNKLSIPQLFSDQEKSSFQKIEEMIEKHKDRLPENMFRPILTKIHGREK